MESFQFDKIFIFVSRIFFVKGLSSDFFFISIRRNFSFRFRRKILVFTPIEILFRILSFFERIFSEFFIETLDKIVASGLILLFFSISIFSISFLFLQVSRTFFSSSRPIFQSESLRSLSKFIVNRRSRRRRKKNVSFE